jgi:hypothetical protein
MSRRQRRKALAPVFIDESAAVPKAFGCLMFDIALRTQNGRTNRERFFEVWGERGRSRLFVCTLRGFVKRSEASRPRSPSKTCQIHGAMLHTRPVIPLQRRERRKRTPRR